MNNATLARQLMRFAERLDSVGSNLYRRRAYRHAAEAIFAAEASVEQLWLENGRDGLRTIPGIGVRMVRILDHFFETGQLPLPLAVNRTEAETVHKTSENC